MKVYIIEEFDSVTERSDIVGVYSSLESAKAARPGKWELSEYHKKYFADSNIVCSADSGKYSHLTIFWFDLVP